MRHFKMLDLEDLLINQLKKIIREKSPKIDSYTIDRLKLAIDDYLKPYKEYLSSAPKYFVIDLEATTDGNGNKDIDQEIIEISGVLVSEDGKLIENGQFSSLVKPINNPILSDFCKNLTHISQENINCTQSFLSVSLDLEYWLWDNHSISLKDLIICSWGDDKNLLKLECKNKNMVYVFGPSRNLALEYKMKFHKNHASLKSALEFFGMKFEGIPHRALADAINTANIFVNHILK